MSLPTKHAKYAKGELFLAAFRVFRGQKEFHVPLRRCPQINGAPSITWQNLQTERCLSHELTVA
jgi:hypothetical protein